MAISPEEEMACDPNLSATEVVEILRRHRPLPDKKYYDTNDEWLQLWYKVWQKQKRKPLLNEFLFPWVMDLKSHSLSDPWSNDYRPLRTKVLRWLLDPNRGRSLFWITDPFLVEEIPAATQSLSSIMGEICRLSAIVSYSQYGVSTEDFVLDIIRPLMRKYPLYRRVVLKELADDPTILEKRPRTIFKKLITEPWNTLATAHPFYLENPPLIVVMFRQGWTGDRITEFMELVAEYSGLRWRSPLLWLVSSHPGDGRLMRALSKPNVWAAYEHETLSLDDAETKDNVSRLLRDGLRKIQSCHPDVFSEGEVWPTEEQFTCLTTNISGVYSFARTVLRFIGVEGGNPRQQLETCLASMAGSPTPSNADPFGVHHYFLQRLLVNVAPDAISLLYIATRPFQDNEVRGSAHLLGLGQSECYRSIAGLPCFLAIDPPSHVGWEWHLGFLDEGFNFFCKEGIQRCYEGFTSFSLALAGARLQIMQGLLHIMDCSSISNLLETMIWGQSNPHTDFTTICSLRGLWPSFIPFRREEYIHCLKSFDFHCLAGRVISPYVLENMVYHLHKLFPDCVRTKPLTVVDEQFIEKCKIVAIPKNFMQPEHEKDGVVEYALLGHGDQTVLVLWTWKVKNVSGGYSPKGSSIVIYSSNMLDDL